MASNRTQGNDVSNELRVPVEIEASNGKQGVSDATGFQAKVVLDDSPRASQGLRCALVGVEAWPGERGAGSTAAPDSRVFASTM